MISYDSRDPISVKNSILSKKINLDIKSNTKYKLGITQDFNIFPCSSEISDMINNTSKLVNHLGHEVDNQFPDMMNTEEAFQIFRAYIFYYTYGFLLNEDTMLSRILFGI